MLDNGEPPLKSTSRVVVCILDVNDNPPVFSHKLFNVRLPERLSPLSSMPVYRLVASDPDEGLNSDITYSIEESDEEGFRIDPVTGVVSSSSTFVAGEYNILTVSDQGFAESEGVAGDFPSFISLSFSSFFSPALAYKEKEGPDSLLRDTLSLLCWTSINTFWRVVPPEMVTKLHFECVCVHVGVCLHVYMCAYMCGHMHSCEVSTHFCGYACIVTLQELSCFFFSY